MTNRITYADVDEIVETVAGYASDVKMDYDCREYHRSDTPEREAVKWIDDLHELIRIARYCLDELYDLLDLTEEERRQADAGEMLPRFYSEEEILKVAHYSEWVADFAAAAKSGSQALREFEQTPWRPASMRKDSERKDSERKDSETE